MKITIKARPEFNLPLDAATVALLMQMSSLHYDGRCKAASAVGGFIYGWRNSVQFSPELPVTAASNDLDTVLKICENRSFLGADDQERVRDLAKALRHAYQRWNEVSPQWTAEADAEAPNQADAQPGDKAQPVACPLDLQDSACVCGIRVCDKCRAQDAAPQPPAERKLDLQLNVALSTDEFGMLARIVDAGMWELASEPHTKEDEQLWDRVCAKLQVPGYTRESDQA